MITPLYEVEGAQTPLTDEQMHTLLGVMNMEFHATPDELEAIKAQVDQSMLYRLVDSRSDFHDLKLSLPMNLLVQELSGGSPGRAVMLLHAIAAKTPVGEVATVSTFAEQIFPMGWPTEEAFDACWDGQKDDQGLNKMDDRANWSRP